MTLIVHVYVRTVLSYTYGLLGSAGTDKVIHVLQHEAHHRATGRLGHDHGSRTVELYTIGSADHQYRIRYYDTV